MSVFSIRNILGALLFTGLALSQVTSSQAYDLGPVELHGFFSQGFILTHENELHAFGTSNDGSFEFNEFGLNGSYQLKESIVLSGQLVSRDLGDEGNNGLYIDYLQADLQFNDWFGTRLGRYKIPMGFYNQTRDIDLARSTVFLPQSIYLEAYRPFAANATGGLVYGNLHNDQVGDFDYEFYYGEAGEDDDSCLVQAMEVMLNGTDMDMQAGEVYGGSLQYTPPIDGLRFGISLTAGETDFDYTDNTSGLPAKQEGSMDSMAVASVEYGYKDFLFISEYMHSRQRTTLRVGPTTIQRDALIEPEGFYISGSYRITDKLETVLYWENYYNDINDKHGRAKEAVGLLDHQAWHKAWCLAIRYDLTDWWLIKAEGQLVDGTGLTSPHYNEPGTAERHWNSLALKTTFHF